jgi:hypothetical protein
MVRNPQVQEKGQNELDAVIGRGRLPNLRDRPNLPYLTRIFYETSRHVNNFVVPKSDNRPRQQFADASMVDGIQSLLSESRTRFLKATFTRICSFLKGSRLLNPGIIPPLLTIMNGLARWSWRMRTQSPTML